jgi:hypothetical protein
MASHMAAALNNIFQDARSLKVVQPSSTDLIGALAQRGVRPLSHDQRK